MSAAPVNDVDGPWFWKPDALAQAANVDRRTLYRMIRSGRLPAVKIGGRWRISAGTADALMRGQL
jgi:excisionase family DNA binding protein